MNKRGVTEWAYLMIIVFAIILVFDRQVTDQFAGDDLDEIKIENIEWGQHGCVLVYGHTPVSHAGELLRRGFCIERNYDL